MTRITPLMGYGHRRLSGGTEFRQPGPDPRQHLPRALATLGGEVQPTRFITRHGVPEFCAQFLQLAAFPNTPLHFGQSGLHARRDPRDEFSSLAAALQRTGAELPMRKTRRQTAGGQGQPALRIQHSISPSLDTPLTAPGRIPVPK